MFTKTYNGVEITANFNANKGGVEITFDGKSTCLMPIRTNCSDMTKVEKAAIDELIKRSHAGNLNTYSKVRVK